MARSSTATTTRTSASRARRACSTCSARFSPTDRTRRAYNRGMRLVVAAAVIAISGVASAQPADPTTPAPAPPPPPAPAIVPAPAPTGPQGVMANRWAIDVGLGVQSLKTDDNNIGFVTYEISARLRV